MGHKTPYVSYTENIVWLTSSYHMCVSGDLQQIWMKKAEKHNYFDINIYISCLLSHDLFTLGNKTKAKLSKRFLENTAALRVPLDCVCCILVCQQAQSSTTQTVSCKHKSDFENFSRCKNYLLSSPHLNFAFLQKLDKTCVNLL